MSLDAIAALKADEDLLPPCYRAVTLVCDRSHVIVDVISALFQKTKQPGPPTVRKAVQSKDNNEC
ncbi:hypothetical protein [Gordonia araii]|uniref:hypothetical protein n=1 Tax=Gordonia araii TaxID=263909 RepID=UPI001110AB90|nr:hypothetical protein [Gordonia araii]NNG96063.1 hypothetical protein [Gordonia araii NBRC 100433]